MSNLDEPTWDPHETLMKKEAARQAILDSVGVLPPHWDGLTVDQKLAHVNQLLDSFIKRKLPKSPLYWITVNWKPETDLDTIMLVSSKLASRSFVDKYYYTIEQRGETREEMGKGLHSHFLLVTSHPIAQLRRDLYNTVKKHVGNTHHLDVRNYPMSYMSDKLSYLKGDKWDSDKEAKVLLDKVFRQENNLLSIYTNAPSPTSTAPSAVGEPESVKAS